MVIREPEWTDDDRKQMRELDFYEAGLHSCGYHRDLLDDKSNVFAPEAWTCPVCQGATRYARMWQKDDELRKDKNDPHAPAPGDGRSIYMRLMAETEAAAWRDRQGSVDQQAPRKQGKPAE